jgi:hypothetical protein
MAQNDSHQVRKTYTVNPTENLVSVLLEDAASRPACASTDCLRITPASIAWSEETFSEYNHGLELGPKLDAPQVTVIICEGNGWASEQTSSTSPPSQRS